MSTTHHENLAATETPQITRIEAARRRIGDIVRFQPGEMPDVQIEEEEFSPKAFEEARNLSSEAVDLIVMHTISEFAQRDLLNSTANELVEAEEGLGE